WAHPILREEQGQVAGGGLEVLGVERPQDRIARDAVVEPGDEPFEERHAPDRVVERSLGPHGGAVYGRDIPDRLTPASGTRPRRSRPPTRTTAPRRSGPAPRSRRDRR